MNHYNSMVSQYSLLEDNFEYQGFWWTSENPSFQMLGSLKFVHNEYILLEVSLNVDTEYAKYYNSFQVNEPQIVHGISDIGTKITLYKIEDGGEVAYGGHRKFKFYVRYIFTGKHFFSLDEFCFYAANLELTYLTEWISPRISINDFFSNVNDDSRDAEEVIIRAPLSQNYKVSISEINAKIEIFCGVSIESKTSTQKNLSYHSNLRIEPTEVQSFNWFEDKIAELLNLFSLLVGVPVYPMSIGFRSKEKDEIDIVYEDIRLYYIAHNSRLVEQIRSRDMLTSFPEIKEKLEICIKQWFSKSASLKSVYSLFASTLIDTSMYLEQSFLSRVQALESFHRKVYGNSAKYVSDSDYKAIFKQLKSSIPSEIDNDLKIKLISSLKYGNQFSLRKRLHQIIELYWEGCFENSQENSHFVKMVTNTRNYLTHLDDESKGEVAEGMELYILNERLKLLLFTLFLIELGLCEEDVYIFLKRYKRLSRFSSKVL